LVSYLFNEENPAVKHLIKEPFGGQALRNKRDCADNQRHPRICRVLVNEGIDSISFNPDALIKGIENILKQNKNKRKIIV
jgi:pyruvate,water dikinase